MDGGDGTLREVLTALPGAFATPPLLAVLPSGKTNILALDLGTPHGWTLEAAQLVTSSVWRGTGVAPGEHRPVLLIPGFLAGDTSLSTLTRWLRAAGYRRRAVLVGCDIPGLGRADIAAAFKALGRADAVFGPAEDGGYWLVGLGPRRPPAPFAGVRWSTEHALADTLANCRGHRVALLRRLRDVDTAADLAALRRSRPGGAPSAAAPR